MSLPNNIFASAAPSYWANNLPVIPLLPRQKRPAIRAWERYGTEMPSADEKAAWLENFPSGNIGLPMGPCSGLIAVDIDTDDEAVLRILDQMLPHTPWRRQGKKGEVRIFRYNGEKSTRLKTKDEMLVEFLSTGTQIVLPPSIHPDTGKSYVATGDLWEVARSAPQLPEGAITMIRDQLVLAGYQIGAVNRGKILDFVPAGQRDNEVVAKAGLMARGVVRGERTLVEALGEISHWTENYVEQVVGDVIPAEKARAKLVEFVIRDISGPNGRVLPPGWDEGLSEEDKERLGLEVSEEQKAQSADEIMEWLVAEMTTCNEAGGHEHNRIVMAALAKMARLGDYLQPIDEERLIKVMVSQGRGFYTASSLRKQLRECRKGDLTGDNHDEIARAVLAQMSERGGEIRYTSHKFWQWKGAHWEPISESEINRVVSADFGNLPACRKQSDYSAIVKLLMHLTEKDLVQVAFRGINFANGFLTEDQVMMEHHPDFGQTYVLPYRYRPEDAGNMPLFRNFMRDSWGLDADYEDKVSAVQEAIGATLFGHAPRLQRAFCLFGQPGSGKSVLSQVVRNLLPAASMSAIPPEDWGDKFLPAEMFGKVLNFAGELSEKKAIPGVQFKQIVEGEQITAQHKNKNPFAFKPVCAQWFNSNHLPKTDDSSDGFNRRWLFIEFNKRVAKEDIDPNLAAAISSQEREAIVAWAVEGFIRLRDNNHYTIPASSQLLSEQVAGMNNAVHHFIAACKNVVFGEGKEVDLASIYEEFSSFCILAGIGRRLPITSFQNRMKELRHEFNFNEVVNSTKYGAQQVIYAGIGLK